LIGFPFLLAFKTMLKIQFKNYIPSKKNWFIWLNTLFIIVLLLIGKTTPFVIVIAFFLETVIIGIVQIFKLVTTISYHKNNTKPQPKNNNYGLVFFFIFHYGFFIAVQLIIVFALLQFGNNHFEAFDLINNIKYAMSMKGMNLVLSSILLFNFVDYYINHIWAKAYKKLTVDTLFMQPYKRILIQQFAVILSSFFMIANFAMTAVALLIIAIKTFIDLSFITNPKNNIFSKGKLKA
ncbi:MAG: DUF6498-containing protein, partial [Urechidicola sp.]|nr:DUF6498-containing protein [Urechidicola sp.]